MKILFITQRVDKDDDVLGVYHQWIEALSRKASSIRVICLYQGRSELPQNVRVYSLGKESGRSRIKYIWRFYKYLWQLRNSYDKVFIHMNPEYVVLGWWWWRLTGKKMVLWYNHPLGDLRARLALWLADKVLFTSPFSFAARFRGAKQMPVGVDTDFMKRDLPISRRERSILFVGRLSPIKHLEVLLEAARILVQNNVDFSVTIVGSPTPGKAIEEEYAQRLKTLSGEWGLEKRVVFQPAVPYPRIASVYNQHTIFVNLTPTGSFDKTILEAMACEVLVLVSNKSLWPLFSPKLRQLCFFQEGDSANLASRIEKLLNLSSKGEAAVGRELRDLVLRNHSLSKLTNELTNTFNALT